MNLTFWTHLILGEKKATYFCLKLPFLFRESNQTASKAHTLNHSERNCQGQLQPLYITYTNIKAKRSFSSSGDKNPCWFHSTAFKRPLPAPLAGVRAPVIHQASLAPRPATRPTASGPLMVKPRRTAMKQSYCRDICWPFFPDLACATWYRKVIYLLYNLMGVHTALTSWL